jgi:phosphopantothenoylcysteine decarboxylase/phosphopantothenate--cysteine ligase
VLTSTVALPAPAGVRVVPVTSALELREAVLAEALTADAVVMAAAVADYRPVERLATKRKRTAALTVELVENPDVLLELGRRRRPGQVLVGFAAETGDADGDVLAHGRNKLARKGCDLLVVNEVGDPGHPTGFEGDRNAATVLAADGTSHVLPLSSKDELAHGVLDLTAARLPAR